MSWHYGDYATNLRPFRRAALPYQSQQSQEPYQLIDEAKKKRILTLLKKHSRRLHKTYRNKLRTELDQRELLDRLTSFCNAISKDSSTLLRLLILLGKPINTKCECHGEPLLNFAITLERRSLVEILLDNEVDIGAVDKSGMSSLQCALYRGEVKIVKKLLRIKYSDATFPEDIDIVKFLLGKPDEFIGLNFASLLFFAVRLSDDALKMALSKCYMNSTSMIYSNSSECLIFFLIRRGYKEKIDILLEYGLNLNLAVGEFTPLTYAIEKNRKMIPFLVSKGASFNAEDPKGRLPIYQAMNRRNLTAMNKFLDYCFVKNKANINRSIFGNNFLHQALRNRSRHMIAPLIELQVDINEVNFENRTPFEVAIWRATENIRDLCMVSAMIAQLVRLNADNQFVSQRNMLTMRNRDIRYIFEICEDEITRMKNEWIAQRVCLFDFLTFDLKKLTNLAKNQMLLKSLNLENYKKKYPMYFCPLKRSLKRAIWRHEQYEKIIESVNVNLPALIYDQIFSYLNDY